MTGVAFLSVLICSTRLEKSYSIPLPAKISGLIRYHGNRPPRVPGPTARPAPIADLFLVESDPWATGAKWLPTEPLCGRTEGEEAEDAVPNYGPIRFRCRAARLKNINILLLTNLVHKLHKAAVLSPRADLFFRQFPLLKRCSCESPACKTDLHVSTYSNLFYSSKANVYNYPSTHTHRLFSKHHIAETVFKGFPHATTSAVINM